MYVAAEAFQQPDEPVLRLGGWNTLEFIKPHLLENVSSFA